MQRLDAALFCFITTFILWPMEQAIGQGFPIAVKVMVVIQFLLLIVGFRLLWMAHKHE